MRRLLLVMLLLFATCAAEDISLNRAIVIAQNTVTIDVSPSSSPAQPVVLDGYEYWVVEFDNVWVPVQKFDSAKAVVISEETTKSIYKTHYFLQKVESQYTKENYPTKKRTGLNLMLSDVKAKKNYLSTNKESLPSELDADVLVEKTEALETALEKTINSITDVEALQTDVLGRAASWDDALAWKTDFTAMLDNMDDVVVAGNAYDTDANVFIQESNDFIASSNDTAAKQDVTAFASSLSIAGVPGDLAGLSSSVDEWQKKWLETSLSDAQVDEDVDELYIIYSEKLGEEGVEALQELAYEAVQGITPKVSNMKSELLCYDELSARQQGFYDSANDDYEKAEAAYNAGAAAVKLLDYETAREEYLNAVEYADDVEDSLEELEGVECKGPDTVPLKTLPEIFIESITSPLGLIGILLIIVLVGLYWWNSKKKGEEYEEGYSDY